MLAKEKVTNLFTILVLILAIGFLFEFIGGLFFYFSPSLSSHKAGSLEKKVADIQVVNGEDINKHTEIRWNDPSFKNLRKDEYQFLEEKFGVNTWTGFLYDQNGAEEMPIRPAYENSQLELFLTDDSLRDVYIFNKDNTKNQTLSLPKEGRLPVIRWLGKGLFIHQDVGAYNRTIDQDCYYIIEKNETVPIQGDGQKKSMARSKRWLLHPAYPDFLLETYCLSTTFHGPNEICEKWGVSLITSTKSTMILSFYHILRQELQIGWDDENFFVKTKKYLPDWVSGKSKQELAQERLNIDKAEAGDQMYIIPLKNLEGL